MPVLPSYFLACHQLPCRSRISNTSFFSNEISLGSSGLARSLKPNVIIIVSWHVICNRLTWMNGSCLISCHLCRLIDAVFVVHGCFMYDSFVGWWLIRDFFLLLRGNLIAVAWFHFIERCWCCNCSCTCVVLCLTKYPSMNSGILITANNEDPEVLSRYFSDYITFDCLCLLNWVVVPA